MNDTAATISPVLVTGGAGFAGSYVVRQLADMGNTVVVLDVGDFRAESRFVIGQHMDGVTLERGSIDDWPRVLEVFLRHRPRSVVHAGGIMDTAYLDAHPSVALRTNVGGALNLLEAARLVGGVGRFVFVSTIGVIGRKLYEPIDGNHPTVSAHDRPLGAYSAAKAAVEAFLFTYLQIYGMDVRIVRPSALYGFGMSWFAPNYMKNIVEPALSGQAVRLASGGEVPRDYTNVVDFASLVSAILTGTGAAERVFYAATGEGLRTAADVADIVRELVPGADIEIKTAWTDVDRTELPMRGRYDIDNAYKSYGWAPRYRDLRDGIADYIARLRAFSEAGGVPTSPPPGLERAPGGS